MNPFHFCPFCGGADIEVTRRVVVINRTEENKFQSVSWEVGCYNCGARISRQTQEEAIAAWNTRRK